MTFLPLLSERLFNRPLALLPGVAEMVASNLSERWGVEPMTGQQDFLKIESRLGGEPVMTDNGPYAKYLYSNYNGIAAIPVLGKLANRGDFTGQNMSGVSTYEGIKALISHASKNKAINSILLDLDTPGGEATGMGEFAASIRAFAGGKPVWAIADGMAASAGYGIACAAEKIVSIPSGIVGSIGVVCLHLDRSKQLDEMGVKPTLIHAGKHKVDGNAFAPLGDGVRADIQASVDAAYNQFVALVAKNRPNLTEAAIRATEARVYDGNDAVKVGLADMTATFEETIEQFSRLAAGRTFVSLTSTTPKKGISAMTEPVTAAPAVITEAEKAALRKEGMVDATQRFSTILNHEGIKGDAARMAAAFNLAEKSPDMVATDVVSFATTYVPQKAASGVPTITQRMADADMPSPTSQAEAKSTAQTLDVAAIFERKNRGI